MAHNKWVGHRIHKKIDAQMAKLRKLLGTLFTHHIAPPLTPLVTNALLHILDLHYI